MNSLFSKERIQIIQFTIKERYAQILSKLKEEQIPIYYDYVRKVRVDFKKTNSEYKQEFRNEKDKRNKKLIKKLTIFAKSGYLQTQKDLYSKLHPEGDLFIAYNRLY